MKSKREYKIDDYTIEFITFFNNGKYNYGIDITWSGPIGFGHLTLHQKKDGTFYIDTECLGKKFTKKILELVTKTIIESAEYDELKEGEDNE